VLIIPRSGADRANLLDILGRLHTQVSNLRSSGGANAYECLLSYLEWTDAAVRMLSNQISSADLERLVLTKGYERLLAGIGNMDGSQVEVRRVVNSTVRTELDQRVTAFDETIKALNKQMVQWTQVWVTRDVDVRFVPRRS
jgi:hypothetical protein